MPIQQITPNNTFAQWLTATQALIEQWNFVEDSANATYIAANNVYAISNTVNSDVIFIYYASNNISNISNSVNITSSLVFSTANNVYNTASFVYSTSNNVNIVANNIFNFVGSAYNTANAMYALANSANLAIITDDNSSDITEFIYFGQNTTNLLTHVGTSSGKLTYNPSTGTISSTNYNSLSDINLKTNIEIINNPIETIKKIEGVSFNWKDNGKRAFGIIAQELEKILPELVEGSITKTVNYIGLIAFLINAVKDLDNRLKKLE